jgi:hypothetical protein
MSNLRQLGLRRRPNARFFVPYLVPVGVVFAVLAAVSLFPARAAAQQMKLLTRDTGWV